MLLRSRAVALIAGIATVTALASAVPAQASSRIVLSQGHVDVLDIAFEDGALEVVVHDETVEPGVERDPDDVLFHVKPEAKGQVPSDPRFAFLGAPGRPVWTLPQDNDPNLLFAGLSTEELEAGVMRGDTVTVRLVDVCGPADVSLFTVDEFGAPHVSLDSGNGLPDATSIGAGLHQHTNWAFEAAGDYVLTFVATGRLAATGKRVSSGPVRIVFHVGPLP